MGGGESNDRAGESIFAERARARRRLEHWADVVERRMHLRHLHRSDAERPAAQARDTLGTRKTQKAPNREGMGRNACMHSLQRRPALRDHGAQGMHSLQRGPALRDHWAECMRAGSGLNSTGEVARQSVQFLGARLPRR
eukprot:4290867-Pleurochrysis_carterae.AAC.1